MSVGKICHIPSFHQQILESECFVGAQILSERLIIRIRVCGIKESCLRQIYRKRMSNAIPKGIYNYSFSSLLSGMDGTRTRDPLRDRQVF